MCKWEKRGTTILKSKICVELICILLVLLTSCMPPLGNYLLKEVSFGDTEADFSNIVFMSYSQGQVYLDLLDSIDDFHSNSQYVSISDNNYTIKKVQVNQTTFPVCVKNDNFYTYSEVNHALMQMDPQTGQEDLFFSFPNDTQIIGNYAVYNDYIIWIEGNENRSSWKIRKCNIDTNYISTLAETNYLDNDFYTDLDIINDWFAYAQVDHNTITFNAVNIMTGEEKQHSIDRTELPPKNIECNGDILLWSTKVGNQYHGYLHQFDDNTTAIYHDDITNFTLIGDTIIAYSYLDSNEQMKVSLYSIPKQQVIQQFDEMKSFNYIRTFAANDTHSSVAIIGLNSESKKESLFILKSR